MDVDALSRMITNLGVLSRPTRAEMMAAALASAELRLPRLPSTAETMGAALCAYVAEHCGDVRELTPPTNPLNPEESWTSSIS